MANGNPRVNFAITNNLGDVLFRGEAVSRVSDTNRTSPTTWVHCRSLSPEIIEKIQFPNVADKLQIRQSNVSDWENDVSRPEYEKLVELAKLYQVSIYDLLGVPEEERF